MRSRLIARLSVVAVLWCLLVALTGSSATATRPTVLPPDARVHGYSLTDAVRAVTAFNFEACPDRRQQLPFQNLCVERTAVPDGDGLLLTGEASYTVKRGTYLFHNLADVSDGPPVLGAFPTRRAEVGPYWFSRRQLGADLGTVTVDGRTATLTRRHVVGPVAFPEPLSDGGRNVTTQAVFIAPLPVGTHVIRTATRLGGPLVAEAYDGLAFFRIVDTITVTVIR